MKASKKKLKSNQLFPDSWGMFERFTSLRNSDPNKLSREKYYSNYNRANWFRSKKKNDKRQDPNFGQFKSKIDAAQNIFISVFTDRKMFVRIIPRYADAGLTKSYSDKISAAFHRHFIKPWEERFNIDVFGVHDMVFEGKGIEHWQTPGCVYTKNIPVENVFPDTNAGPDPKMWSYVFIVEDFTVPELLEMKNDNEDEDDDSEGMKFNSSFVDDILENPSQYSKTNNGSELQKDRNGEHSTASRDYLIPIVFAYIKEGSGKKKVSRYVFPANIKAPTKKSETQSIETRDVNMRFLAKKEEYCECISNCVHNRMFQITRSYWKLNSFAKQIYLSTMLYDKSMSLILRAAKRAIIMYWRSADTKTQEKLLNQTDDEIQVVGEGVEYMTTTQQSNITPLVEAVRQIMIDTENGQSLAQAPGSQNVKGYAITAEEASIRNQKLGEAEALNLKVLMVNDAKLYKEIYRRALENNSEDLKKSYKAFTKELKDHNIDPEFYEYENVYFAPYYLTGGSNRLANAQGVLQTLLTPASSPGQIQAQRDMVGAYVGNENVDDYLPEKAQVDPIVLKVGGENEDLDNPYVNPKNIPVLPTDKHMQEIPLHIADYEIKLKTAQGILQLASQQTNPFRKMILTSTAGDIIAAQDNKGGHITGHIQMVSNSKASLEQLAPLLDVFKNLQGMQDKMAAEIQQINQETDSSMQQSDISNEKLRHLQATNQLTETHATNMNDIALSKELEKKQSVEEKNKFNAQVTTQSKGMDLAHQEASVQLDLQKKQNELDIEKEKKDLQKQQGNSTTQK